MSNAIFVTRDQLSTLFSLLSWLGVLSLTAAHSQNVKYWNFSGLGSICRDEAGRLLASVGPSLKDICANPGATPMLTRVSVSNLSISLKTHVSSVLVFILCIAFTFPFYDNSRTRPIPQPPYLPSNRSGLDIYHGPRPNETLIHFSNFYTSRHFRN
ncbi:hypothetical protein BOTBODRAFT_521971 [Botryobasidium botryosum FD-172 SS1]|uniref:Uncharacterized protein n=1 Tax=Botryobasidium botryosum (strain FD-172 SS1) TaxID=930990 RepID=A0A067MDD5_BOTB1|nr:hypothetical protein BOTBODRAFT_521971 [Botryobasidium botryosum FD-172 SS1]